MLNRFIYDGNWSTFALLWQRFTGSSSANMTPRSYAYVFSGYFQGGISVCPIGTGWTYEMFYSFSQITGS